jgi:hypothetical protein
VGTEELLLAAGVILGPSGAAFVGVRVALNGVKEDVKEIKKHVREINGTVGEHGEKIAVLEERSRKP